MTREVQIGLHAVVILAVLVGCRSATSPPAEATRPPSDATPIAPEPGEDQAPPQGTGCDDLVVIEAANTPAGIAAENAWIRQHYPGYQQVGQSLGVCGKVMVDVIEIEGPEGGRKEVFFDISSFFGKW